MLVFDFATPDRYGKNESRLALPPTRAAGLTQATCTPSVAVWPTKSESPLPGRPNSESAGGEAGEAGIGDHAPGLPGLAAQRDVGEGPAGQGAGSYHHVPAGKDGEHQPAAQRGVVLYQALHQQDEHGGALGVAGQDDGAAFELFLLGRKLMLLGEKAIPPSRLGDNIATGVRLVAVDVINHPGSSISQITGRTGFPQTHVSLAVAKLRELGAVTTAPDPADRRRTLVQPVRDLAERGARHAAVSADQIIAETIGADARDRLPEVLAALELLGQVITPEIYRRPQSEPAEAT